MDKFQVNPFKK